MMNVFFRPTLSAIGLKMSVPTGRARNAAPKPAAEMSAPTAGSVTGKNSLARTGVSAT